MSSILFVHIRYPEFDRCSGDTRLSNVAHPLRQQVRTLQPEVLALAGPNVELTGYAPETAPNRLEALWRLRR